MTSSWCRCTQPDTIISRNENSGGAELIATSLLRARSNCWTVRLSLHRQSPFLGLILPKNSLTLWHRLREADQLRRRKA
jgi:hypothetical protein